MTRSDAAPSPSGEAESLPIFVNRRRFEVGPSMTGAGIAALLGVPAENAVVETEGPDGHLREIDLDAPARAAPGQQFLVTRQYVMGGAGVRPGVRP